MATRKNQRRSAGRNNAGRSPAREQRREEFLADSRRRLTPLQIGGLAIVIVVAVAVVVVFTLPGGGSQTTALDPPAAAVADDSSSGTEGSDGEAGAAVSLPVADITEEAAFYTRQAAGGEVSFFVVRGSDDAVRSAFNACQVCYQQKLGYEQDADVMVCKNCNRTFPIDRVGIDQGGCNPVPLEGSMTDGTLTFSGAALSAGAPLFQ